MGENITAIIIALIGAITGVLAFIGQFRKGRAEAADILTDTATALIVPLRAEMGELREQLYDLRIENERLRYWAKALVTQVVQLGGVPVPEPPAANETKQRNPKTHLL